MNIDTILAMPGCERLREWCAIGPVQRAAFEDAATLLVAQAITAERDACAKVCAEIMNDFWIGDDRWEVARHCDESIRARSNHD